MKKRTITVQLVGKPDDLSEEMRHKINALDATCFPNDELFSKNDCFWWIAYVDGVLAGFAGLRRADENHVGFLCRAGVCRKFGHLGIQRKLIEARIRYAKRVGMKGVSTYVATYNWTSIANLIRCGLRIVDLDDSFVSFEKKI